MKVAFLCTTLFSCIFVTMGDKKRMNSDWCRWKSTYGVQYNSNEESRKRAVWEANYKEINKHNKDPSQLFKMKMNQFGDLTNLEYQQILGALVNITVRKKRQIGGTVSATELRSKAMLLNVTSIDYRTLGYVTEVKNQGACGSCWAFSTTGAIEGQLFKKTGMLVSLSEQNLVDCSKDYGTYGCKGAWMGNAYKYVLYNGGIESALTYPYIAKDNQPCHYNSSRSAASITDYKFLPKGNEQALADALATIGPITVAVDASLPSFQFYKSGIYNDPRCSSTKLNHAVLLIGYGSEAGQDFWVIKNSWNTSWGENGYMKMARNNTNFCGIAAYTLFPVM
ncbi:procathepsin L-like [Polypterus senegalus]|uniref:procathepsin L-like n=1 Tax=Polypterus senegalus TaxID=55291 RepID=UPI0019649213|nr:procathepsin L-like [Polypterus senegalus]